jgi:uncharacterized protein (DUF1015 family)
MDATRTNLSPIFGLYSGASAAMDAAGARASTTSPLADVADEFGVRHRLWSLVDTGVVSAIAADLEPRTFYIADGHHRYETALAYRDKLAAAGALADAHPANFVMMFVCSMADPGLVVLPTHRVVSGLAGFDPKRFLESLRGPFRVESFAWSDTAAAALQETMAARGGSGSFGFGVRGDAAIHLATLADAKLMEREAPTVAPAVRQLDVSLLDVAILRKLLGIDAHTAADDGRLRYFTEAAEALATVRRGEADVACLLNATRLEEVEAVCDSGETMPEKSTYFHPKLGSGFVFHSLEPQENHT